MFFVFPALRNTTLSLNIPKKSAVKALTRPMDPEIKVQTLFFIFFLLNMCSYIESLAHWLKRIVSGKTVKPERHISHTRTTIAGKVQRFKAVPNLLRGHPDDPENDDDEKGSPCPTNKNTRDPICDQNEVSWIL